VYKESIDIAVQTKTSKHVTNYRILRQISMYL